MLKISYTKAMLFTVFIIISQYLITKIDFNILKIILSIFMYLLFTYFMIFKKSNNLKINPSVGKMDVFFSFLGVIGMILLNFSVPTIFNLIIHENIEVSPESVINISTIIIAMKIIFIPFVEELYFRKTIMEGLTNSYGYKNALLMSAFLFSLAHIFTSSGLLIVFLSGVFLGYIYNKTKNLYLVFFLHFFNNLVIFFISPKIVMYLSRISFSFSLYVLLGILAIGIFLIFTIRKISYSKISNLDLPDMSPQ
jgi:membrane protease YdiL (CAAX protease family)